MQTKQASPDKDYTIEDTHGVCCSEIIRIKPEVLKPVPIAINVDRVFTAYVCFAFTVQEWIKEHLSNEVLTWNEIRCSIATMWKELSQERKAPFVEEAARSAERETKCPSREIIYIDE